jgi:hypothetical protein
MFCKVRKSSFHEGIEVRSWNTKNNEFQIRLTVKGAEQPLSVDEYLISFMIDFAANSAKILKVGTTNQSEETS